MRAYALAMLLTAPCLATPIAAAEGRLEPSQVSAFIGTWPLTMTNPAGAQETVRIWNEDGRVRASIAANRFPPQSVTGIMKDGEMLVLSLSRFENGRPIWAVVALTLEGDTMRMAQMLELSQTIKRGSGTRALASPSPR